MNEYAVHEMLDDSVELRRVIYVCHVHCCVWCVIPRFSNKVDLHLSITNAFVSSKIYGIRDDFAFGVVNFPFLDAAVPRRASYTFRNLLGLLESAIMLRTSTREIKF